MIVNPKRMLVIMYENFLSRYPTSIRLSKRENNPQIGHVFTALGNLHLVTLLEASSTEDRVALCLSITVNGTPSSSSPPLSLANI